jgi:hypothetical protein
VATQWFLLKNHIYASTSEPDCTDTELLKENENLHNRVRELELEVTILRQTLRELAGK